MAKHRKITLLARYAKGLVAGVGAVGAVCAAAMADQTLTLAELGAIGGAVATALGVVVVPNRKKAEPVVWIPEHEIHSR